MDFFNDGGDNVESDDDVGEGDGDLDLNDEEIWNEEVDSDSEELELHTASRCLGV